MPQNADGQSGQEGRLLSKRRRGGDTNIYEADDLLDLELCAVEEVNHTSTERIGTNLCDDLPPGLPRVVNDGALWAQFLEPTPTRDPWADQTAKDAPDPPLVVDPRTPMAAKSQTDTLGTVWQAAAVAV